MAQFGSLAAIDDEDFERGIQATDWYRQYVAKYGEAPDLNTPDYDYREAVAAGAQPVPYPGDIPHWPSQFKGPGHPNRFVNGVDTITGQPQAAAPAAAAPAAPAPAAEADKIDPWSLGGIMKALPETRIGKAVRALGGAFAVPIQEGAGGAAFGTLSPGEEAQRPRGVLDKTAGVVGHVIADLPQIPRRSFEASETLRKTGHYDAGPMIEAGTLLMGVGAPFAQKNAAGIFGGRLARTADQAKLAQAEKMAAEGAFPDEIWTATGWFQGADKKWRFEIPDQNAVVDAAALRSTGRLAQADQWLARQGEKYRTGDPRLDPEMQRRAFEHVDRTGGGGATIPMQDYLVHDELYAAYPDLAKSRVGMEVNPELKGSFNPETGVIRTGGGTLAERSGARDTTVLHEAQHAIQQREGFARGGDPREFQRTYSAILKDRYEQIAEINKRLPAAAGTPRYNELLDMRQELVNEVQRIEGPHGIGVRERAQEDYKRLAGETEARNVQHRADWDEAKRRDIPPSFSQDVPFERQDVQWGSLGPSASVMNDPLYHASPRADLTELQPSTRGPLGPGVYTSPIEHVAERYGVPGGMRYELPPGERDIFNGLGDRYGTGYPGWKDDNARLLAAAEPEKREALAGILDKMWMGDGYPMYARIKGIYGGDEGAQALFQRAGFKGISGHVDGPEVLLFGPQGAGKGMTLGSGAVGDKRGGAVAGFGSLIPDEAAAAAGPSVQSTIRAYHSSPYDFDRFDMSKIGTGEGAQTYGHGLYFAENPAVSGRGGEYWQQFAKRFPGAEGTAVEYLRASKFDPAVASERLRKSIDIDKRSVATGRWSDLHPTTGRMSEDDISNLRAYIDQREESLRMLESGKPIGPRTYEVGIRAKPEQLLDWDAPLSLQSPDIQRSLSFDKRANDRLYGSGAEYYRGLISRHAQDAPRHYSVEAGENWAQRLASDTLREAGIPGIKYLDQGSRSPFSPAEQQRMRTLLSTHRDDLARMEARGVGDPEKMREKISSLEKQLRLGEKPSHNFVITDDQLIDILRKFALPGAVGGGVGFGSLMADEQ